MIGAELGHHSAIIDHSWSIISLLTPFSCLLPVTPDTRTSRSVGCTPGVCVWNSQGWVSTQPRTDPPRPGVCPVYPRPARFLSHFARPWLPLSASQGCCSQLQQETCHFGSALKCPMWFLIGEAIKLWLGLHIELKINLVPGSPTKEVPFTPGPEKSVI